MSSGDPTVKLLSPDQAQRLMSAHLDLARSSGDIAASLAYALKTILSTNVVIFEKRDRVWSARARAFPESQLPEINGLKPALDALAAVSPAVVSEPWDNTHERWTLVGCKTRPPMVIAIQGDWARASGLFVLVARDFALMLDAQRTTSRARAHLRIGHRVAVRFPAKHELEQRDCTLDQSAEAFGTEFLHGIGRVVTLRHQHDAQGNAHRLGVVVELVVRPVRRCPAGLVGIEGHHDVLSEALDGTEVLEPESCPARGDRFGDPGLVARDDVGVALDEERARPLNDVALRAMQ
jgi:hypothetical protein